MQSLQQAAKAEVMAQNQALLLKFWSVRASVQIVVNPAVCMHTA